MKKTSLLRSSSWHPSRSKGTPSLRQSTLAKSRLAGYGSEYGQDLYPFLSGALLTVPHTCNSLASLNLLSGSQVLIALPFASN